MSDKNNNVLFLFSIGLNILCLLFAVFFIYRKGGISYIKSSILNTGKDSNKSSWGINSYYKHKKSQFEILAKSNDSIIFLGDSLTDEGEWVELLGNPNIKNRGISGDTTWRVFNRLDAIAQTKPKKIFLMVGINDLVNEKKSIQEVLKGYKDILRELQIQTPQTEIFIQSILPVNNDIQLFLQNNNDLVQFNLELQEIAKQFNCQYIDIFSRLADSENQLDAKYTTDGVHLNGKAYLIWKEVVENYVAVQ
ncbi:MAG: GDSL-type esterase/lipase family protein [Cyanobacteria bacterium P01_A01_bin.45]